MGNTSMVTHRLEGVVTCPTRRSRPAQAERLQLVAAHHAEQGRKLLAESAVVDASLVDVKRRLGKISQDIDELVSELRLILALLSTRVNAHKKPWPFLYEPEPEDTTFQGRGIFAFCAPCDMLSRLLHP
eukprot:g31312.t1